MNAPTDYIEDELYGQRLLISVNADQRELLSNIRAARAILHSFADVTIIINAHTMSFGHKNPEYTIDGQLGDRKGIMGEKGVTAGFKAAKKQGCKIVVIDLDEHILQVRSFELSKYISRWKADFVSGMIAACYVVFNGEAVMVNACVQTRQEIAGTRPTALFKLERLRSLMQSRLYATLIHTAKIGDFSVSSKYFPQNLLFFEKKKVVSILFAIFAFAMWQ